MDIILYDDIDWSYEHALETYLESNNKNANELTVEDNNTINEYAGLHIAYFITWIVKKDYQSDYFDSDAIDRLRKEEITGSEFLEKYCDGKLASDMLKDEVNEVVSKFYDEDYFRNYYAQWVIEEICDLPFEFGWDWNDCHSYEAYLDDIYEKNI